MSELDYLIGNNTINSICRGLLLLFVLLNFPSAFKKNYKGGTGYLLLFIVMTFYCVFYSPDVGDNYTSMNSYYLYFNGVDSSELHYESIYFRIMDFVPFGYVYYRIVLWGAACLLFVWLMKKMQIKSQIATLAVLTFALPILLYYQRAAFAYILLYCAAYCYVSKGRWLTTKSHFQKKFQKKYILTFVVLLLCAIPFHRTMPVYIVVLLCAIFIPKNKLGITILLLGAIVFSTGVVSNSISILSLLQEDTREQGMLYLVENGVASAQNLNGWIAYYMRLLPIFCMIVYGLVKMIKSPDSLVEIEKVCLINTLLLIVMSTLFVANSFSIQIKFRNAAMMPWTVFLASYYTRNSGSKECSYYALATIVISIIL